MDSTQAVNQVAQTVGAVLDELGKRFGATGAHLWEQLVGYAFVSAIAEAVVGILVICAGATIARWLYKQSKVVDPHNAEDWIVASAVVGIIVAVISAVILGHLTQSFAAIFWPEAAALKALIP